MKYRKLGSSDLIVSEIAFGSWRTFSESGRRESAIACVRRAFDRDSYLLATKLYFPMSDTDRGLSRAQIHKQIDVLTGKYAPGAPVPPESRAADDKVKGFLNPAWFKPRLLEAVRTIQPLAAEAGLTLAQFALAWVLRRPNVAAAIVGATRPEQIDENVAASGHPLPSDLAAHAERLIGAALGE